MSKIAEKKVMELGYSKDPLNRAEYTANDLFNACVECYDQAMQDIQEQAEKSVIEKSNGEITIEDLVAYNKGFKTGREIAMQDFLEKACEWLSKQPMSRPTFWTIEDFKNYMQDEIQD